MLVALFTLGKLVKRQSMSCPLCAGFLDKTYTGLSREISVLADTHAKTEALKHKDMFLDIYMMYYRREYERLFQSRKEAFLITYKDSLQQRYVGHSGLCIACSSACFNAYTNVCVSSSSLVFDSTAQFCFHSVDATCDNCAT
jgi:hypothetical protein